MKTVYIKRMLAAPALFLTMLLFAQEASSQAFTIAPKLIKKDFVKGNVMYDLMDSIKNNTPGDITLKWTVISSNLTTDVWDYGICDNITCFNAANLPNSPATKDFDVIKTGKMASISLQVTQIKGTTQQGIIKALVSDPVSGQSDTVTWILGPLAVGIESQALHASSISIYPVPAGEVLHVNIENQTGGVIALYNILGEKLYSKTVSASGITEIPSKDLATGTYFVRFMDNNGNFVSKQFSK